MSVDDGLELRELFNAEPCLTALWVQRDADRGLAGGRFRLPTKRSCSDVSSRNRPAAPKSSSGRPARRRGYATPWQAKPPAPPRFEKLENLFARFEQLRQRPLTTRLPWLS